ncbi:MAG TPA: OmpA family protein, partial [Kofleriaceae bacterium]
EPRVAGFSKPGNGKWYTALVLALIGGAILGFMFAPGSHADEAARAKTEAAAADKAREVEKQRADGLQAANDKLKKDKDAAEASLAELFTKKSDVDKKAQALADEEKKLQATIDKSQGSVDTEGDEIHLKLVDKVLFAVGDDQLTDKGKAVLDKVAIALKDLPEKQVWVQGHTDDQPIFVKPKKKKTDKPEPVKFMTNWELSAARALQVVHYLQDTAKIDPTRLAALAFGQYRPVSRRDRSANRRIEIVLYPKKAVLEKK